VSTAETFVLASVHEDGADVSDRGAIETPSALPLRWSAPEYSPANPDPAG
jgi:hypothetical protein